MGEKQNQPFQLLFDASLKLDFQGSRANSNGGPILVCELDERLGLKKLSGEHLSDSRPSMNKQFALAKRRELILPIAEVSGPNVTPRNFGSHND